MNNNFAVFEKIGEDWEQYSIWMNEEGAVNFLKTIVFRFSDRKFYILQKHTGEVNVL